VSDGGASRTDAWQVYSALEDRWRRAAGSPASALTLLHYERPGWTYHAKGLWLWPSVAGDAPSVAGDAPSVAGDAVHHASGAATSTPPVLTVLGSSNFSQRSVQRDVEFSLCLVTADAGVRALLERERQGLCSHAREVTKEVGTAQQTKHVSILARMAARLMRSFF